MPAAIPIANKESPKIESAGVEAGSKIFVGPADWPTGLAKEEDVAQMSKTTTCFMGLVYHSLEDRIRIRQLSNNQLDIKISALWARSSRPRHFTHPGQLCKRPGVDLQSDESESRSRLIPTSGPMTEAVVLVN